MWWLPILRLLTGDITGALERAHKARLDAKNDADRIAADLEVKRLEALQEQRRNAKEIRLATAGFLEMRLLTVAIALPFVAHLWAVGLDTLFGFGWRVPKWPSPFDEWQGAILLSFFGVAGGVGAVRAVAGAIAVRRR